MKKSAEHPELTLRQWNKTWGTEVAIFIGIYFLMGVGKLSQISDYWNLAADGFVCLEIQHNMTLNRWEDLKHYFKLSNPCMDVDSKGAKWYTKLEPLLNHFYQACLHYY